MLDIRKLMGGLGVTLALVLAVPLAHATTPTPAFTPAATPTADESTVKARQNPALGGEVYEKASSFEGGLQVGKSSENASLFTFMQRGNCLVDPPSLAAVGDQVILTCAAPNAAVGDFVVVVPPPQLVKVAVSMATVEPAGTITFILTALAVTQDLPATTFQYVVVR